MKILPKIVLGTWPWGVGAVDGDEVFGNNLGVEELKPVFKEAMVNGLNLRNDSWFSHIAVEVPSEETENEWC